MNLKKILTFGGWPILALPFVVYALGLGMNQAAIHLNHLQMPYMFPDCANVTQILDKVGMSDPIHTCMTPTTHLKVFADTLIYSGGVASIGDQLMEWFEPLKQVAEVAWVGAAAYCAYLKRSFYLQ